MFILTDPQFFTLLKLSKGEIIPGGIHPTTRKWLQREGFIKVQRVDGSHKLQIEITDLGREVISTAVRKAKV